MNHLIRRSLVVSSLVLVASLTGCAVDSESSSDPVEEENVSSVQSEVSACPATPAASIAMQRKVHRAFDYAFGGANPFGTPLKDGSFFRNPNPCIDGSEREVLAELDVLRDMFADGTALLGDVSKTAVCGIPAASRRLNGAYDPYYRNALAVWGSVQKIGQKLDACWGTGASAFTYLGNDGKTVMIDPEPAKLTQTLTGSTGATAAAVFVNSGASTNVVKWTSTFNYNTTLVAGTPCATTDLGYSTETLKVIQASGNYKRCN